MNYTQTKRRVKFKVFNQELYEYQLKKNDLKVKDGLQSKHGWLAGYGLGLYDNGETVTNFTAAIVESDDCKIYLVELHLVEFVSNHE